MKWITLEGGAEVFIDTEMRKTCKKCGKQMIWGTTRSEKFMPVSITKDGKYISHFADCPNAKDFRR